MSLKALEIKTSNTFNLVFANNTALWCCFIMLLVVFISYWIILMPIEIPCKEARANIETHPVSTEAKKK